MGFGCKIQWFGESQSDVLFNDNTCIVAYDIILTNLLKRLRGVKKNVKIMWRWNPKI